MNYCTIGTKSRYCRKTQILEILLLAGMQKRNGRNQVTDDVIDKDIIKYHETVTVKDKKMFMAY